MIYFATTLAVSGLSLTGVVSTEIPAMVSAAGSAGILAWYIYYDVAYARPARDQARTEADRSRVEYVERVTERNRIDTAEQLTRQADHYEQLIQSQNDRIAHLQAEVEKLHE